MNYIVSSSRSKVIMEGTGNKNLGQPLDTWMYFATCQKLGTWLGLLGQGELGPGIWLGSSLGPRLEASPMASAIFTHGVPWYSGIKLRAQDQTHHLLGWRPKSQFGGRSSKRRRLEAAPMASAIFTHGVPWFSGIKSRAQKDSKFWNFLGGQTRKSKIHIVHCFYSAILGGWQSSEEWWIRFPWLLLLWLRVVKTTSLFLGG